MNYTCPVGRTIIGVSILFEATGEDPLIDDPDGDAFSEPLG